MASKLDRLQKKGFKVNEAALSKIARGDQEPGGEYSEININDIEIMDNASRAVVLFDEAMIEFKKLLELSITLDQVDQIKG